jgi:CIC family chloride channel protein
MTDRLRFLVGLVFVAVGAAAFAIAFRSSLAWLYRGLFAADNVVDAVRGLPPWMRFALPVCGATAAGVIAFFRSVPAQGVSNVMEAVALGNVRLSLRTTLSRVLASWAAIAAGMSIGREGPLIEFGGSLGATFSRVLGVSLDHTRVLVAAGTAAGFAAAYNTPFAAVLFVLETIIGIAALDALLPAMAATVIATALTRAVVGGGPIYGQRAFVLQSAAALVWFGALGLAAAVAAACFKGLLSQFEQALLRHPLPQPWRAALGGVLVGAIAIWIPEVAGNGYEPLNALLNQQLAVGVLIVLIIAKVIATSASVASGVPGGIFTAVLLLGGALGTLWAHALVWFGLATAADTGSYALVGMAATTAASIHAPLTAAVLVFELSGDYPIVLPLLIATVVSTSVSRGLGTESVYEAELRRKGLGWELTLEGRQLSK